MIILSGCPKGSKYTLYFFLLIVLGAADLCRCARDGCLFGFPIDNESSSDSNSYTKSNENESTDNEFNTKLNGYIEVIFKILVINIRVSYILNNKNEDLEIDEINNKHI
ncbi:hypothetical protein BCR32DRAFT_249028 [Anaeromyces robustus]|uniref:Uncharacterized protein n=1 Tax=Anaeromyces robustus TaxID=1754192 RepID=A0A1Y1WRC8_9FUNG|nr:hypothetical protein BCR32DRAFT_249028 [Anaeromyces robustus]|eukprot:ORX76087.1 hypothetical protein BCR32DRAFT_249028 [Anaeromyces robustus]